MRYLLSFILFSTVLFYACIDDEAACIDETNPDCPNYDPCSVVIPASSAFVMFDSTFLADTIFAIAVDTIPRNGGINLRALNSNLNSYEWKIGTDERIWDTPHMEISFTAFSGDVNIQLTTTVKDEYGCLIEDELMNVQSQLLHVTDIPRYLHPIFGKYEIANIETPSINHVVTITGPDMDGNLINAYRLKDFPISFPDCDFPSKGIHIGGGYDWVVSLLNYYSPSQHCRKICVIAELSDEDRDEIHFFVTYDDTNGERIAERFMGRRVE